MNQNDHQKQRILATKETKLRLILAARDELIVELFNREKETNSQDVELAVYRKQFGLYE